MESLLYLPAVPTIPEPEGGLQGSARLAKAGQGFRVWGLGFRVLVFMIWGLGFRVSGHGVQVLRQSCKFIGFGALRSEV